MNRQFDIRNITEILSSVLPKDYQFIALHEPEFGGDEWDNVKECLQTGWVSSAGKYVDKFEMDLVKFTGIKYAVAVVNGTAALHTALKITGVQENDEVLVPALTFVATANAVTYCGAVPHFVDSQERTLGLDPRKLREYLGEITKIDENGCFNIQTGRRIRAVVPMHTFGHPVDMDPLMEVCAEYQLEVVEDAAESLGSYYKGRHTGNWGRVAVLSFNGNKVITTGGGGAILTNCATLAKLAKHLTTTAKISHRWAYNHDLVGYNYRLPNINAALGCAQLKQLPSFLARKRMLAENYKKAFQDCPGIKFFTEPDFARSNYWLNTLVLDQQQMAKRDDLLEATNIIGIMTRPAWTLLHKLPMYAGCPRMDLSIAENLEMRIINIPSSASLGGFDG